ncbi:MAG TPA: glycosyltransferase family 4 protein [Acidimicrobiales bacterium]|nr:glycosyltransferase family 4 protein [Acidimicrobiales bacterium]
MAKHAVVDPLVQHAGACLAIGRRNAEFYRFHGAAEQRIVEAPYCVDNDYFARFSLGMAVRDGLLRSVGLDPGKPTILFAAKLIPRKRPLDVVEAHRLMERRANLVVVGDGALRGVLSQSVGDHPSERLLGFKNQSELGRWYAAADIFVLPSEFERWGLAVNEAMAAGAVPVVSDVVGCAPDLVEPGGGRTFPVGDVSRLAQVLDELTADEALLARLRTRGRELIEQHSINSSAAGFERGVEVAVGTHQA